MLKKMFAAAAAATTIAIAAGVSATPANAAYFTAGRLTCHANGNHYGRIVWSERELRCRYLPAGGGPASFYTGVIKKYGVDLGITGRSAMVWDVLARTPATTAEDALAGNYYGIGSDVSWAAGAGSKLLAGGWHSPLVLQALSVQVQEGVNLAAGVQTLQLRPAGGYSAAAY